MSSRCSSGVSTVREHAAVAESATRASPELGVVIVNYFGGDRTLRCLDSLQECTWPAEHLRIVLVDNGSDWDFVAEVRSRYPDVRYIPSRVNLGFGGACNRGFDALDDCEYIALLNNDAIPDPGWLEPLVQVLQSEPNVGAATPAVLLKDRYVRVAIRSPKICPGGPDRRDLGVQLCGARVDGREVLDRAKFVRGFWGWEEDEVTVGGAFAWTNGDGCVLLPVETEPSTLELRLGAGTGRTSAEVSTGDLRCGVDVDIEPTWYALRLPNISSDIVNNRGMELRSDGSCADRGFLDVDDYEGDAIEEVFGWSGAAVLLSREFLRAVGMFDEHFFLYYEDADLSWRGRLQGWSYRYVPESRVRHEHSATVGSRSALVRHLSDRNRLLMLTKCAPRKMVTAALLDFLQELGSTFRRDVLARIARGRRPIWTSVRSKLRVLAGYTRHAPASLRLRSAIRSRATVGDEAILTFVTPITAESLRPHRHG